MSEQQTTDLVVSRLDLAWVTLKEAKTIQDTKKVLDAVIAAGVYAKRQGLSDEIIGAAYSIRIHALQQLGEMLQAVPKAKGGQPYQKSTGRNGRPVEITLKEAGIDKDTSSLAQRIASLPQSKIDAVAERRLTLEEVKREFNHNARVDRIRSIVIDEKDLPTGKFPVIYADPPWRYEFSESESRSIENQYPTMSLDDICALKIPASDEAILFLWATSPKLAEAMRVINSWGFTYRSSAVWIKEQMGMGYYFRQQHEFLLVATKGDIPAPPAAARPRSVVQTKRAKHSEKPEQFREFIEAMYPTLPRIELFAREKRDKWESWGNQI